MSRHQCSSAQAAGRSRPSSVRTVSAGSPRLAPRPTQARTGVGVLRFDFAKGNLVDKWRLHFSVAISL